ncbi:hypothetical protein L209DRAFT_743356 [Thermothelomyces heterothallicus CBS 203.75]
MAPPQKSDKEVAAEFTSYYLQRATTEFAEDLDKVRAADDFKNDALQILVTSTTKHLNCGTKKYQAEKFRRALQLLDLSTLVYRPCTATPTLAHLALPPPRIHPPSVYQSPYTTDCGGVKSTRHHRIPGAVNIT